MSNVINVDQLSKKYVIRHSAAPRSRDIREEVLKGIRRLGRRILRTDGSLARREEFWALRDVSFEVHKGERLGIVGRNGAGKSTLLKVLSRITEPTSGIVRMKGRVSSLLEVGTGFHQDLTGRENIYLNGSILGMSRQEIRRKFDDIVAFAEVEKFIDTPVKRYSSGMYVRLAFAVAAHLEPDILIVDEVLSVGDTQFQKKCLGKMEEVSTQQGRTVLFVSHNVAAVRRLCQRGLLLTEGKVAFWGSAQEAVAIYLDGNSETGHSAERRGESIVRKAEINNKTYLPDGCLLEVAIDLEPPEDDIGIDLIIRHEETMLIFAGSAYTTDRVLTKNVRKARLLLGPIDLAVGSYVIDVNIVKPGVALYEENPALLHFSIDQTATANRYNFNLLASWARGYVIPPQQWSFE